MLHKFLNALKQNFWPISALIFCPCHLPLSMAAAASLTAGTTLGAYISTYYSSIETVLAVAFSFYFVLAFMIWVVRGPSQAKGAACAIEARGKQAVDGLSTRQIVVWGLIGMFLMPALVAISAFTKQSYFVETINYIFTPDPAGNVVRATAGESASGFIWLISLSTVVMIPVMIIWLVWMWLAWSKHDFSKSEAEGWSYEYE